MITNIGHTSYNVFYRMRITKFTKPTSVVSMVPNTGLLWKSSGIGMSLHGDFHYKYKKGM